MSCSWSSFVMDWDLCGMVPWPLQHDYLARAGSLMHSILSIAVFCMGESHAFQFSFLLKLLGYQRYFYGRGVLGKFMLLQQFVKSALQRGTLIASVDVWWYLYTRLLAYLLHLFDCSAVLLSWWDQNWRWALSKALSGLMGRVGLGCYRGRRIVSERLYIYKNKFTQCAPSLLATCSGLGFFCFFFLPLPGGFDLHCLLLLDFDSSLFISFRLHKLGSFLRSDQLRHTE